jgi:hypothetical protein
VSADEDELRGLTGAGSLGHEIRELAELAPAFLRDPVELVSGLCDIGLQRGEEGYGPAIHRHLRMEPE